MPASRCGRSGWTAGRRPTTSSCSSRPTCWACRSTGRAWSRRRPWAPPFSPAWRRASGARRRTFPAPGGSTDASGRAWRPTRATRSTRAGGTRWRACGASRRPRDRRDGRDLRRCRRGPDLLSAVRSRAPPPARRRPDRARVRGAPRALPRVRRTSHRTRVRGGSGRSSWARTVGRAPRALPDVRRVRGRSPHARGPRRGLVAGVPRLLFGHSMGGLIAFLYLLRHPETMRAGALSAPAFRVPDAAPRALQVIARLLGRIAPRVGLRSNLDERLLSRDPAVGAAYVADPLVHRRASAGFYCAVLAAQATARAEAAHLAVPLLILQGDADRIVDPAGAAEMATRITCPHELVTLLGYYHELLNEPEEERARVLALLDRWFDRWLAP